MNSDMLEAFVAMGHEQRGVEFKAAGDRDNNTHYFAKVTRAAMAMANRRDGGYVVLGIDDKDPMGGPRDLTETQAEAWLDHDVVSEKMAVYADPPIMFHAHRVDVDGGIVVVLEVAEFEDIPVLCVKEYATGQGRDTKIVLRRGGCYVRGARKRESVEVSNQSEMRELIDLATEKQLRRILEATSKAGGAIVSAHPAPSPADLFARELGDL